MNHAGTIKVLTDCGAMAALKTEHWAIEGVIYILVVGGGNLVSCSHRFTPPGAAIPWLAGKRPKLSLLRPLGAR